MLPVAHTSIVTLTHHHHRFTSSNQTRDRLPSRRGSTAHEPSDRDTAKDAARDEGRRSRPRKSVAWRGEGGESPGRRDLPSRPHSGRAVSVRQVGAYFFFSCLRLPRPEKQPNLSFFLILPS